MDFDMCLISSGLELKSVHCREFFLHLEVPAITTLTKYFPEPAKEEQLNTFF